MAFPTVETRNESAHTAAVSDHVVSLPTGIQAGDLLVVIIAVGGTSASQFGTVTGWNELLDENVMFGLHVWYRLADGSEGATQTFTQTSTNRSAHVSYRISGAENPGTQPPELSTVATGTSNAPDPGTVTPTGGAKDYLFITFFAKGSTEEADDDTWTNNAATNYGQLLQKTSGTGGTNVGALLAACERTANASSENAVWPSGSTDTSTAWRAFTLAVHPAPPAPSEYIPPRPQPPAILGAWWPRKPQGRHVGGGLAQAPESEQPPRANTQSEIIRRAWDPAPTVLPTPVRIAALIPAPEPPSALVPFTSPSLRIIRSWWPFKPAGRTAGASTPEPPPPVDNPPPRSPGSQLIIARQWRPEIQIIHFQGQGGMVSLAKTSASSVTAASAVTSVTRKGAAGGSQVRAAGVVSSSGTTTEAHSGASTVAASLRVTSVGFHAGAATSLVSAAGGIASAQRKAASSQSIISAGARSTVIPLGPTIQSQSQVRAAARVVTVGFQPGAAAVPVAARVVGAPLVRAQVLANG